MSPSRGPANGKHKPRDRRPPRRLYKSKARSAITNGRVLLPDIDQRSTWIRRVRDLISMQTADLGGADTVSSSEAALIRRCAVIQVELEQIEQTFAQGIHDLKDRGRNGRMHRLEVYQRGANTLRRLLSTLGLQRRPKEVEDLQSYLARNYPPKEIDADDAETVETSEAAE